MQRQHTPTLARTDIEAITPDRLVGDIDFTVYDQLTDFEHREQRCEVDRMISYLGAAIENKAIEAGEKSKPSTFREFEAVKIVLSALRSKYPAWFGQDAALADLDQPVSDEHLSKSDIRSRYFSDELRPETESVDGDDWSAQKRVIIPILAIALENVREQMEADQKAATRAAQREIKRTIIREAHKKGLSEADIDIAVDASKQTLDNM